MAERGSKGCCHAPFYCSEFYSYCSFLALLEKRVKMKKVNKINGFCTFLHVFLPSGRTLNPLLSAKLAVQKGCFFISTEFRKGEQQGVRTRRERSGREQSGGLFSPTWQRAQRGDRRGQRRIKSLALRQKECPVHAA